MSLGYAQVPKGHIGWDGHWGTIRVQGPELPPEGWVRTPQRHELASAMAITEWICPFCGADNDVWGEGALESWMECGTCLQPAYLVMDPDGQFLRSTGG